MSQNLFVLGISHHTASVELRDRLYASLDQIITGLVALKEKHLVKEIMALSTCNRFELLGCSQDMLSEELVLKIFCELQNHLHPEATEVAPKEIREHCYFFRDQDAVKHVFKVVSSLDSLVVGETQITGQFKKMVSACSEHNLVGTVLHRLSQNSLSTAKKIRSQTNLGTKHVSVAHASLDLAKNIFSDLGQCRFFVIGAGEMASLACKYIRSYNATQIVVANRTRSRAVSLIEELGVGNVDAVENMETNLKNADVVVSATSSIKPVVGHELVKQVMTRRRRPLVLLDIATPRDIDPACGKLEDVYLFDIDDLQGVVEGNKQERQKAVSVAETLVDDAVQLFCRWLAVSQATPTISSIKQYIEDTIAHEHKRSFAKFQIDGMTAEQQQKFDAQLSTMLKAVSNRIVGDVGRKLKEYDHDDLVKVYEVLNDVFSHDTNAAALKAVSSQAVSSQATSIENDTQNSNAEKASDQVKEAR